VTRTDSLLVRLLVVFVAFQVPVLLRLRRKYLVSAVMTTRAESRISHGLLVVRSWLTDLSADVALVFIVFVITCTYDD
jgi:hypothetical protein